MATFAQNIAKIRGDAIYGSEVREAIAEAITQGIEQSETEVQTALTEIQQAVDEEAVYGDLELISGSDYRLILGGNL